MSIKIAIPILHIAYPPKLLPDYTLAQKKTVAATVL